MQLEIIKANPKPFEGDGGESIPYFWYKAKKEDGFVLKFGSKNEYKEKELIDIDLEKTETGYKESY